MIKKNSIYQVGKQRMVCILVDNSICCLCPISAHKKDAGYSIKMNKPVIYSTDEGLPKVGEIKRGVIITNPSK